MQTSEPSLFLLLCDGNVARGGDCVIVDSELECCAAASLTEVHTPNGSLRDAWGVSEARDISVQPVLLNKQVQKCSVAAATCYRRLALVCCMMGSTRYIMCSCTVICYLPKCCVLRLLIPDHVY